MKKTISLLGILLIMIIPIVIANNEFGKITSGGNLIITDVDVKVDDLSSRNLDYGEEISRVANPESDVVFQIEVKNNHTSLDMEDVKMVIQIDDLDLEESTSQIDLNDGEDKVLELTFTLPSDAEERDYDVFIEVKGELNDTELHKVEYDLVLVVEEIEGETTSSSTKSALDESIANLNLVIEDLKKTTNYYEPYTTCVSERKGFEETVKTRDNTITTLTDYKTKFETCDNEKTTLNTQIIDLQTDNKNLAINITRIQGEKKNVADTRIYWVGGVVLVGLFLFSKYKDRIFPKRGVDKIHKV